MKESRKLLSIENTKTRAKHVLFIAGLIAGLAYSTLSATGLVPAKAKTEVSLRNNSFVAASGSPKQTKIVKETREKRKSLEGAKPYTCLGDCTTKYNQCIAAGHGVTFCQSQYNTCAASCGVAPPL